MTGLSGDPPSDLDVGRADHHAFMRVRLREGYATGQVDAFVDQAVQALRSPGSSMRPEDVRAVRFTPVRVRAGYDMREVDAFLDGLEEELAARQPATHNERVGYSPAADVRKPVTAYVWAARMKGALLLLVVVLWVYAGVFTER